MNAIVKNGLGGGMSIVGLTLALGLGGCQGQRQLQHFKCGCSVLTDTDGYTGLNVRVCAPDRATAEQVAKGCGSTYAHATAEKCTCGAVARSTCAKQGDCLSSD